MVRHRSVCGHIIDQATHTSSQILFDSQILSLPTHPYHHKVYLSLCCNNIIYVCCHPAVPPAISHISPTRKMFSNEAVNFTVHFQSSYSLSTTVTWLRDNVLIPSDQFSVNYESSSGGTTSLMFPLLRRSDSGRYSVLIENGLEVIPIDRRTASKDFEVLVSGEL